MLYGQCVWTDDPSKVKVFCPDLSYVSFTPGYGDHYLIEDRTLSLQEFRRKFKTSVLINPAGIDLNNKEKVLSLLGSKHKVPESVKEGFLALEGVEFWNAVKIYSIAGVHKFAINTESLYPLFLSIGASKTELIKHFSTQAGTPVMVLFSSILTFFQKMKHIKDINVSPVYKKDLTEASRRVFSVNQKIVRFLKSDMEYSDLLYFLLSL